MKVFSKSVLVLLALAVAGTPARSRSLHIAGTAGYLSKWQFDGEVAETATSGELVGPLVWKHIGLCSVNGPQVKPGKIYVRFSGAGSPSKIDATILFDSARCTYSGNLFGQLGRAHGLSRCWRNSSVDFNQVRPAAIKLRPVCLIGIDHDVVPLAEVARWCARVAAKEKTPFLGGDSGPAPGVGG